MAAMCEPDSHGIGGYRSPTCVVRNGWLLNDDLEEHLETRVACADRPHHRARWINADIGDRGISKRKESQLDMSGDRTSCQRWWPNQFRLLLSSLANTLIEAIWRLALQSTELARAYVGTIRLKLFKIGAVILINSHRIRFLPASGPPAVNRQRSGVG